MIKNWSSQKCTKIESKNKKIFLFLPRPVIWSARSQGPEVSPGVFFSSRTEDISDEGAGVRAKVITILLIADADVGRLVDSK